MRSVEDNLQKPLISFIDNHKEKWGLDFWIKPDGPPFITLDIHDKLKQLEMNEDEFKDLCLRLGCPMLVNQGCLRIALTGFDKKDHTDIVEHIKERLDFLFSLTKNDEIIKIFHSRYLE